MERERESVCVWVSVRERKREPIAKQENANPFIVLSRRDNR
jgi:hypothetical protein